MNLAKTNNKKMHKQCAFLGCTNTFYGIANKDYCDDPRCKEIRNEHFKSIKRTRFKDPDAVNLLLGPNLKKKLKTGQVLNIRCRAKNSLNVRCPNKIRIVYNQQQGIYPCFCEDHRSAFRRQRYSLQKG
jgi:hypothetical protein